MSLPPSGYKGRGAAHNPPNRYHTEQHEDFDDGWATLPDGPVPPRTEVLADAGRRIISYNRSPDLPFDRSINPYRGCEHGCIYCFARPGHAWLDCSPGLDFETRIFHKPDAAERLRCELGRAGYSCAPLALGVNTDAWQPVERRLRITRALLEVLLECRHPVGIVTKSALVERDIDLLTALAEQRLVHVTLSVTTLDAGLAQRLEPRAASPRRRLASIRALRAAGIPVSVLVAPVIPVLNDHELERILEAVHEAGALDAGYVMLRLPHEVADLFRDWLARHEPLKADRVMKRLREMHGGREYDARFHHRLRGEGAFAGLIAQRFACARRRLDFPGLPAFDCSRFRPPRRSDDPQLELFGD
ncbi:MAG TPA: PA0069 family radical SAM protein [Gammaproteobacteria bacterium]|nr:PA0069 family radical SAM protein [Gammaproteobacteria bacterium]